MPSKEQVLRAVAHARDEEFARLFLLQIGVAAETHPDILRKALAHVFDLSAVQNCCERQMLVLSQIQRFGLEVRSLLEAVKCDLDELERRMDALAYAQHLLENPTDDLTTLSFPPVPPGTPERAAQ